MTPSQMVSLRNTNTKVLRERTKMFDFWNLDPWMKPWVFIMFEIWRRRVVTYTEYLEMHLFGRAFPFYLWYCISAADRHYGGPQPSSLMRIRKDVTKSWPVKYMCTLWSYTLGLRKRYVLSPYQPIPASREGSRSQILKTAKQLGRRESALPTAGESTARE